MTPLIVLLATFAIALLALRRRGDPRLAARIALAAMLVVTGISHFTMTAALAAMVPPVIPWPVGVVYATGIAELAFAALLLARPGPRLGWLLAAFLVALLPANIYSAIADTGYGASGAAYLWFRVPLQVLFIAWALAATGALTWRPHLGHRLPQS
jgi:uncharacterized membrane protein